MSELSEHTPLDPSHPCIADITAVALFSEAEAAAAAGTISNAELSKARSRVAAMRSALRALRITGELGGLTCPATRLNDGGFFRCPFEADADTIAKAVTEMMGASDDKNTSSIRTGFTLPDLDTTSVNGSNK
jgi:hypothetical protein